jgi:hypothetical protein
MPLILYAVAAVVLIPPVSVIPTVFINPVYVQPVVAHPEPPETVPGTHAEPFHWMTWFVVAPPCARSDKGSVDAPCIVVAPVHNAICPFVGVPALLTLPPLDGVAPAHAEPFHVST